MTKSQSTMYGAKMGFKILLRTWRTIINGLESPITPLVVHESTKKCKIIKNWSAPKMHFSYIKMIVSVSSFQWAPFWCHIGALEHHKVQNHQKLKCSKNALFIHQIEAPSELFPMRPFSYHFGALVVHWSTKKYKIIKNWSAPKMHFLYIKMNRSVNSFQWAPFWCHFGALVVHWST